MVDVVNLISADIDRVNRILITSHKRPDGDAIGSVLGLGLALQEASKDIQMVLVDGVPKNFRHLKGSEQISKKIRDDFEFVIVLDCSEFGRVGVDFGKNFIPNVNIDHHMTNLNFATHNLVDIKAPSTAEMIKSILPGLNLSISLPIADALLTGIITDTLGFRTNNMRPNTLRIAAELIEVGSDLPLLYQKALLNKSYEAIRYWGAGLSSIQKEGKLLWATLTQEDRKEVGYPGYDDADLINVLSSVNDIDIAIIFIEQPKGSVKVSWRAKKGYDVSQIATSFGGGGHLSAAGADIKGDLGFIEDKVLNTTRQFLEKDEYTDEP
jgi:phosphoesterase RecJ-like protein